MKESDTRGEDLPNGTDDTRCCMKLSVWVCVLQGLSELTLDKATFQESSQRDPKHLNSRVRAGVVEDRLPPTRGDLVLLCILL